ncbi:hypothetical protein NI40_010855 [Enterobacter sp. E20]|nr:hypothetical protein NI40_010855 [Enterobacter sp. E20]
MHTSEFRSRKFSFGLTENTDELLFGETLLYREPFTLLMKTLLISQCTNQQEAGQKGYGPVRTKNMEYLKNFNVMLSRR